MSTEGSCMNKNYYRMRYTHSVISFIKCPLNRSFHSKKAIIPIYILIEINVSSDIS